MEYVGRVKKEVRFKKKKTQNINVNSMAVFIRIIYNLEVLNFFKIS